MINSKKLHYFFGSIFIAMAIYQWTIHDMQEFTLYGLAGLAFIINTMAMEPRLSSYKKPLTIFTWLLMIATGILFLYLLQFKN